MRILLHILGHQLRAVLGLFFLERYSRSRSGLLRDPPPREKTENKNFVFLGLGSVSELPEPGQCFSRESTEKDKQQRDVRM